MASSSITRFLLSIVALLALAVFVLVATFSPFGKDKTIAVEGSLKCKEKPAVGVKVKLYEQDTLWDDEIDVSYTDENGNFKLRGTAREMSDIEPAVIVIHRCNHGGTCSQKWTFALSGNTLKKDSSDDSVETHEMKDKHLEVECMSERCRVECYD